MRDFEHRRVEYVSIQGAAVVFACPMDLSELSCIHPLWRQRSQMHPVRRCIAMGTWQAWSMTMTLKLHTSG